MNIQAIDQLNLAAIGADPTRALITNESGPLEYEVRRRGRSADSAFVGASTRPGRWAAVIATPSLAIRDRILAALDSDGTTERRLVSDYAGVAVEAYAAVRSIQTQQTTLRVLFEPTVPIWEATAAQSVSATLSANGSVTANAPGNTRLAPVVRIKPTAQRGGQTAAIGWKRRRRYKVENLSDESWYRLPIRIDLGSTTAIVSGGRALASGNDVRVWYQGREIPRTLLGWNTAQSYVWLLLPSLGAGKSAIVEVVWHNAAAGAPPVLSYPDLPAFDLANSSNAKLRWLVTAGNGGWYLSSGTAQPATDMEVPGAWRAVMTLDGDDNDDDTNQTRSYLTGGSYSGRFNATRAPAGTKALVDEGLADGVAFHHPFGIQNISVAFTFRNDFWGKDNGTDAIGRLKILGRSAGAAGWETIWDYPTKQHGSESAIARATYTPAGAVKHIACAVWPFDELAIQEDAKAGRMITARWSDYVEVAIDATKISITLDQAETEIYELGVTLAVDPNDGQTVSNDLVLGMAGGGSGLEVPRCAVELNQVVVLDATTRTAQVWNSALSAKVEDLPNYAVRAGTTRSIQGVNRRDPASEWLPVRPNPAGVAIAVSEPQIGTLQVTALTRGRYLP